MDPVFARKLLDTLVENAVRVLGAGFGVNWAESSFFDIIRLLRQEESLKAYFLTRAGSTLAMRDPGRLDVGMVPRELIELVAHELRWPEIQVMARARILNFFNGDAALAVGDIATSLSEAYEDDWQDREFYEHYSPIKG